MVQKVSRKNYKKVFANLIRILDESSKEYVALFCGDFNRMLDDQLDQDFYGTEGQSDPRGDHREDR
jgi:hypothetical protein